MSVMRGRQQFERAILMAKTAGQVRPGPVQLANSINNKAVVLLFHTVCVCKGCTGCTEWCKGCVCVVLQAMQIFALCLHRKLQNFDLCQRNLCQRATAAAATARKGLGLVLILKYATSVDNFNVALSAWPHLQHHRGRLTI